MDSDSKEAYNDCLSIWTLIAQNPGMTKQQAYKDLGITEYSGYMCPACDIATVRMEEYDGEEDIGTQICVFCPIKKWPDAEGEMRAPTCLMSNTADPNYIYTAYDAWVDEIKKGDNASKELLARYSGDILATVITQWEDTE